MKLFVIGLLLVQSVVSILSDVPFTRGSCLQFINAARAELAERLQIANMNDLMYEKRMEKAIHQQLQFVNGCPNPSIISHKGLDVYLNVGGQNDLIVELLSAADNSMMACVKSRCEENGQEIISIVTDLSNSSPIPGTPGSQCPSGRVADSQGLCTIPKARGTGGYQRKGHIVETVRETLKILARSDWCFTCWF